MLLTSIDYHRARSSFLVRFLFFLVVLQTVVYFIHSNIQLSSMVQHSIVQTVYFILFLFDTPLVIEGNTIRHINMSNYLIVDNECTGLMLMASVCSVIMSFNYSMIIKIKMMTLSIIILYVENIFRIIHLLYQFRTEGEAFYIYHIYVWQAINFLIALLLIVGLEHYFKRYKVINE